MPGAPQVFGSRAAEGALERLRELHTAATDERSREVGAPPLLRQQHRLVDVGRRRVPQHALVHLDYELHLYAGIHIYIHVHMYNS